MSIFCYRPKNLEDIIDADHRNCLVNLLSWRSSVERLMRSLKIIVMDKHCMPLADAQPTAHPRVVETVDSHFERVKPLRWGFARCSRPDRSHLIKRRQSDIRTHRPETPTISEDGSVACLLFKHYNNEIGEACRFWLYVTQKIFPSFLTTIDSKTARQEPIQIQTVWK